MQLLDEIAKLNLPATRGGRELIALAMLANDFRLVLTKQVPAKEIARILGQSISTTRRHLRVLRKENKISFVKNNKRSHIKVL